MIFRSVVHLPLNHLYERVNTPQGMLVRGIVPHFRDEAERFLETLYEVAPAASCVGAALLVEARLARHRRHREFQRREARGLPRAMKVGQAYRRRRWNGRARVGAGCALRSRPPCVFNRMLKKLGLHRVRLALSSGAPLPEEVQALWQIWGVNLKNLYRPDRMRRGDRAVRFISAPGLGRACRIRATRSGSGADDEIIGVSPGSFSGYWQDDSRQPRRTCGARMASAPATSARSMPTVILRIVDRKKDIVITAGGKNVSPSRIETTLKSSPYISEASVIGEGRKYLTALDRDRYRHRVGVGARQRGVAYSTYRSLATNREVYRLLIDARSSRPIAALGRVEQVKSFRILDRELDPEVEGEAVTATRKIKRSLLQQHFAHLIVEMYATTRSERIARQLVH